MHLSRPLGALALLLALPLAGTAACSRAGAASPPALGGKRAKAPRDFDARSASSSVTDGVKISTYLGDGKRRYYGPGPVPERLEVLWRVHIGSGVTSRKEDEKAVVWSGTGWTGQPTVIQEFGRPYLFIGGYDHGLRKIDMRTGGVVWRYEFDDVIKGTNTVFENPRTTGSADRYIVTAGSRRGFPLPYGDPRIAPFRAVSGYTGKELWRLPVPRTESYSQDADSSGLLLGDRFYQAVESGYMYALDPSATTGSKERRTPKVLARSRKLYDKADVARHKEPGMEGSNLVVEASPAVIGDRVYIASGSGHVYGLRRSDLKVVWDFKTGSDIDGTTVVTREGHLMVAVEKQYIPGRGGVLELDPSRDPKDAVVSFFPTENRGIGEWKGGVVGSVALNDEYDRKARKPRLAAFASVDGNLYIVARDSLAKKTVLGPNKEEGLPTPTLVHKASLGGSISTPVIVDDHIVAAGYDRKVRVYKIRYDTEPGPGVELKGRDGGTWWVSVRQVAAYTSDGSFESTPLVWRGRIYIGCRDGYLYCLGDPSVPFDDQGAGTAYGE